MTIVDVSIAECQNGYARVAAIPDNSRCNPPNGGPCYESEQVFLKASGSVWTYLTSGSGITCQSDSEKLLGPDLVAACVGLGLRHVNG